MTRSRNLLALPGSALLLIFLVAPVCLVFWSALFTPEPSLSNLTRVVTRGPYVRVLYETVEISVVVSLICFVLGFPFAAFVAFQPKARQVWLMLLVLVPLWMSILVRTYAWMVVLGREGVVNDMLQGLGVTDDPLRMLFTRGAVVLAMVQILLPLMIVSCHAAMTQVDQTLVRAARVMGASPHAAFFRVFVPLCLEGAINGIVIVFILSMGFFITPALLGGRRDAMMANVIATQISQANWGFAAALAVALLLTTLLALVAFRRLTRRFVYHAEG